MAPIIQHDADLKRDISHVSDIKGGGSGDVESVHADVADNAAAGYVDPTLVISEEENTRLRRRVHRRILPLLTLAYLCQALDKGTTATSSIMGWLQDINAKGQDYALTSTFMWIGIIVGEPLANQAVRRLPVAKVLGVGIVIWSVLLIGIAFSLSVPPVFAIRFLLGFFESIIGPCLLTLTVQWYLAPEQPLVQAVWQCMVGANTIISGILGYGFYHVKSHHGLKGWQWMHIAIAIVSFISAIIIFIFLPDSPTQARWASEEEKVKLVERVRANNQGLKQKKFKKEQVMEAFTDPYSLCLFFLPFFQTLVIGGVNKFNNLLLNQAFHFDVLQSQLLNIPLGTLTVTGYFVISWFIRRYNQTLYTMIAFTIPNIIATIVILVVPPSDKSKGGLVVALYMLQIFQANNPAIFLMLSRNSAGQTKKSVTYAITYMGWAGGNAVSPQLFQARWAPRYLHSMYIHLALYGSFISLCLLTRWLLVHRNNKKIAEQGPDGPKNERAFDDLTDIQNPDFRYCL
ncbi:putative transporter [Vanrija pseudolonga]|uniref:Purtative transporter n=1 Tax=Vanrija pseudolonga TaxID=143232 RepID=A0AAF0Y939_9TREE|nr:purtative transporter [Vanrija pseudolonga]